jgi:hypothetical protein
MTEAPTNKQPVNQAALRWLVEARAEPEATRNYLAQLALWGLEKDQVRVQEPMSPNQPLRSDLEEMLNALMGANVKAPANATEWFTSNPSVSREEQTQNLEQMLRDAESPRDAAQIVVETAYDRLAADSGTSPE